MRQMGVLATKHVLQLVEAGGSANLPRGFIHLHPPSLIVRESTARVSRAPGGRR
jgi:DNA-binding LacI/PurR family transcriptional regulator